MTFVLIFGPPSVGKMTIGKELAELSGYKLFHNHMTIEFLIRIFDHGTKEFQILDKEFRFRVFEEFAKSKLSGLIFTFVWALDVDEDRKYVQEIVQIFRTHKRSMYFVELEAERKERLRRNNTTDRLAEKPSKRNIELSKQRLLEVDKKFILNTKQDNLYLAKELLQASHYLKIDNTHLQPKKVALQIKNYFKF